MGDSWIAPPELRVMDVNKSVTTSAGAYTGVVSIQQFELYTGWPTRITTITSDYKEGVGMVKKEERHQQGHLVTTTTLELIGFTLH